MILRKLLSALVAPLLSLAGACVSGVPAPAQAQPAPAQWNYSFPSTPGGVAVATYPGNMSVLGSASLTGPTGYTSPAFTITKTQQSSRFYSFDNIANGTGYNAVQVIVQNGTLIPSTNANFLSTATPDKVAFSGWCTRGGTGTDPLVCQNNGVWLENNSQLAWANETDVNNEGATQSEASDNGGVGLALNTGSTYSPGTGIWIRRMTGAGTGPGFLRGITIEGARNVGLRIMAMDTTTYPGLVPAAPGTIIAIAVGSSSDSQYRYNMTQNGQMNWGPGGATTPDTTFQRTGVNTLTASGTLAATTGYFSSNIQTQTLNVISGPLQVAAPLQATGTVPTTNTGTCTTLGGVTGGTIAGAFSTTGICASASTIKLTFASTSTSGYVCNVQDLTTAITLRQTAFTNNSCTLTLSGASGATDNMLFTDTAF